MTITVPDVLTYVKQGYDLQVVRKGDSRVLRVLGRSGRVHRRVPLDYPVYDALMLGVVSSLAKAHPRHFRVDLRIDYYGKLEATVKRGFFRQSRLGFSQRHLILLQDLIRAQEDDQSQAA